MSCNHVEKTAAICALLKSQMKPTEIARRLKCSLATVYRVKSRGANFSIVMARRRKTAKKRRVNRTLVNRRQQVSRLARATHRVNGWEMSTFPSASAIAAEMTRSSGRRVSRSAVWRDLCRLGFRWLSKPRWCSNKPEDLKRRLDFAILAASWNPDKIVFSDEVMISINQSRNNKMWVPPGGKASPHLRSVWPAKILIWGAIAKGKKWLVVIRKYTAEEKKARAEKREDGVGGLGAVEYRRRCLYATGVSKYCRDNNCVFWQDGASAHGSSRAALLKLGLNLADPSPRSPDMNVIEMAWSDLKRRVSARCCQDVDELERAVKEEWAKMDTDVYLAKFKDKVNNVIRKKGGY